MHAGGALGLGEIGVRDRRQRARGNGVGRWYRCQRYWRGDPAIFFLQGGGGTEPRNTRPRHPRECQFATFAKKEAMPSRGLAPSPAANPMERLLEDTEEMEKARANEAPLGGLALLYGFLPPRL